jgi:hypothetical protein
VPPMVALKRASTPAASSCSAFCLALCSTGGATVGGGRRAGWAPASTQHQVVLCCRALQGAARSKLSQRSCHPPSAGPPQPGRPSGASQPWPPRRAHPCAQSTAARHSTGGRGISAASSAVLLLRGAAATQHRHQAGHRQQAGHRRGHALAHLVRLAQGVVGGLQHCRGVLPAEARAQLTDPRLPQWSAGQLRSCQA